MFLYKDLIFNEDKKFNQSNHMYAEANLSLNEFLINPIEKAAAINIIKKDVYAPNLYLNEIPVLKYKDKLEEETNILQEIALLTVNDYIYPVNALLLAPISFSNKLEHVNNLTQFFKIINEMKSGFNFTDEELLEKQIDISGEWILRQIH